MIGMTFFTVSNGKKTLFIAFSLNEIGLFFQIKPKTGVSN